MNHIFFIYRLNRPPLWKRDILVKAATVGFSFLIVWNPCRFCLKESNIRLYGLPLKPVFLSILSILWWCWEPQLFHFIHLFGEVGLFNSFISFRSIISFISLGYRVLGLSIVFKFFHIFHFILFFISLGVQVVLVHIPILATYKTSPRSCKKDDKWLIYG